LNLEDEDAVKHAFDEIQQEGMEGILVQRMLRGGVDLMIGVTEDPLFGPPIAFGLGGIHVEILARLFSIHVRPPILIGTNTTVHDAEKPRALGSHKKSGRPKAPQASTPCPAHQ